MSCDIKMYDAISTIKYHCVYLYVQYVSSMYKHLMLNSVIGSCDCKSCDMYFSAVLNVEENFPYS